MAIFYMRASLIKASSGKSAVASAAYQAAQSLYSERLGQSFQYSRKEEVLFSEILLPEHAPSEFCDRETLWNAVEKKENKANSRYARQFVVAVPREWSKDEAIERSRTFIQEALVNKGMVADWAFHDKMGNPHLHIMCTVRGFNQDGTWATMERKAYALDSKGERIPDIDPKTGEQKTRTRKRNGNVYTEKLWKRETVLTNSWNKKAFLTDTKKAWADCCNRYLSKENQIDSRSYRERGINLLPQVHEGAEARAAFQKGILTDSVRENIERRKTNRILKYFDTFIRNAKNTLEELKYKIQRWIRQNDQGRDRASSPDDRRIGKSGNGISDFAERRYDPAGKEGINLGELAAELEKKTEAVRHRRHH